MLNDNELRRADARIQARKAAERALWVLRSKGSASAAEAAGAPRDLVRHMKAALAGTTTSSASALAELHAQAEGLTSTVASIGLFDALRGDAIEGELWAQYAAAIADPIAGEIIEGRGIRVTSMAFASKALREQQTAAIIVLTKELLRFGTAVGIIEVLMRRAIARATDAVVVPQLVAGAPTVAASGMDSPAVLYDLRRALAAIPSGADARFRVGVGPEVAKRLALQQATMLGQATGIRAHPEMTPTGGTLAGLPCSVSEALGADAIVTEGTALVASTSEIQIDHSENATVEMDTAPANASANDASPAVPVESTLLSLFQVGGVAMKVTRSFDWAPVRDLHTVRITGAGNIWGLDEGSPPS